MDVFQTKNISPMLIAKQQIPFNSKDYIYELKFDGIRSFVYSDYNYLEIRNKRNKSLTEVIPELADINKRINSKAILDGELIVMKEGKPNYNEIQKRVMMSNYSKIQLESTLYPASFIAYDILYLNGEELIDIPLIERKRILNEVINENNRVSISKIVEENGIGLFEITKNQGLEGVVAKKKDSKYYYGNRTKEWVKFKNMIEDDYIVLGYIPKQNNMTSLIIGQYTHDMALFYVGHVTLGVSLIQLLNYAINKIDKPLIKNISTGNEDAIWLEPKLVCVVEYMYNDKSSLRQPVFKGFRDDKEATDCIIERLL